MATNGNGNTFTVPSSVHNKVIGITGGASGIGRVSAHLLASRGAIVSLADLQAEALETTAASIKQQTPGAQVLTTQVDVRKADQVEAWVSATVGAFGRLDGALNLAGVISKGIGKVTIAQLPDEDWNFVLDINLTGVFNCLRAELKVLSDGGSVVNASSVGGKKGMYGNANYCATKAAVISLTESAALEEGHRGVRVNAVCPGWTKTPMTQLADQVQQGSEKHDQLKAKIPLGRGGEPEEIASLLAFLLGDESKYITGSSYVIDGGMLLP